MIRIAVRVAGLALVGLLAVWAVVAYQVFGHPRLDTPTAADAVLVLGPQEGSDRIDTARALAGRGLARSVFVSVAADRRGSGVRRCGRYQDTAAQFAVTCFVPDPATTRGEARTLATLAARNHWHTVIVVTAPYHVERARMIVRRCFAGTVEMVVPAAQISRKKWALEAVYQSGGYLKALLEDGC